MPIDVKGLENTLAESLKAGMIPPDMPEEFKPEADKKVTEMATAQVEGLAPFIEAFDALEVRLDTIENVTVPQVQEINQQQDQAFEDFISGDFGDLTSKVTGLEGDVGDLKTQSSLSTGGSP